MIELEKIQGFDWDSGNAEKNWLIHQVSQTECEEIFYNVPLIVGDDHKHSQHEARYYCLGHTNNKRLLFLVFTLRYDKIRIISARDMSKKERQVYSNF
jgi:uncharacterized protein